MCVLTALSVGYGITNMPRFIQLADTNRCVGVMKHVTANIIPKEKKWQTAGMKNVVETWTFSMSVYLLLICDLPIYTVFGNSWDNGPFGLSL